MWVKENESSAYLSLEIESSQFHKVSILNQINTKPNKEHKGLKPK